MSAPRVVSVAAASAAQRAGLLVGDELLAIDGRVPRDVIEYRLLVDEADPELVVRRGHEELVVPVDKVGGEPLGAEVSSAVFDRVRTCDNHCEFCFIYQLPKGMRRSLYLKDDDYRLSFLYGNFTTLTRFTELDLERVITEALSPLFVSIHSTDANLRASMLRNRRGATSLRWLSALLDAGIEVHGQIVVCPGVNDGPALDATLAGILDEYPALASVACVPLGVSRFTKEPSMRAHTTAEARAVLDLIDVWQESFVEAIDRRMVFAADEYYLLAGRPFPAASAYDGFPQHENGVGMAAAFAAAFGGDESAVHGVRHGFFASVDGAPAAGYRAPRQAPGVDEHARRASGVGDADVAHHLDRRVGTGQSGGGGGPVVVVTGEYGAAVLEPLLTGGAYADVSLLAVRNEFFGGNIAVTGLIVGADLSSALADVAARARVLVPDVCLSEGRFIDGLTLDDLPRPVEVVASDGLSLRRALNGPNRGAGAHTGLQGCVDRVPVTLGDRASR
jgi:putative radical SAM enzyme (TIGR03279 family)